MPMEGKDDQVQVGPPVHEPNEPLGGARPPGGRLAVGQGGEQAPVDAASAVRLEEVAELVTLAEAVVRLVTQVVDRVTSLEAAVPDHAPEAATAIWEAAIQPLRVYLDQPITLASDTDPVSLTEASGTLTHLAGLFAENALGPGGESLRESPDRLEKFAAKLEAIEPSLLSLKEAGRELLARHDLDPDHVARRATQAGQTIRRADDRSRRLAALKDELAGGWTEQVATLARRASLLTELVERQTTLTSDGVALQNGLAALDLTGYAERIRQLVSWIDKYQDDPSFTAAQVLQRIQHELAEPAQALRDRLDRLERLATQLDVSRPQVPTGQDTERQARQARFQAGSLLGALSERRQALTELRRTKLGRQPDDRFFGTPAKRVNDAIGRLSALIDELQDQATDNGQQATVEPDGLDVSRFALHDSPVAEAEALLAETARYVDPDALETYLANQWQEALGPLKASVQEAQRARALLARRRDESRTQPGFDDALSHQFQDLSERIQAATFDTEALLAETAPPDPVRHARALTQAEQRLSELLTLAEHLTEPASLAKILEARQAAKEADRKRQALTLRREIPNRWTALAERRELLHDALARGLAYLETLESWQPARARTLYQELRQILAASIALASDQTLTIAELLETTPAHLERLRHTELASLGDVYAADSTLRTLETALGPSGAIAELVTRLSGEQANTPSGLIEEVVALRTKARGDLTRTIEVIEQASTHLRSLTDQLRSTSERVKHLDQAELPATEVISALHDACARLGDIRRAATALVDPPTPARDDRPDRAPAPSPEAARQAVQALLTAQPPEQSDDDPPHPIPINQGG